MNNIVVAMNITGDGFCIVSTRFDWLPKEMNTLPCVHVPIDEFIQCYVIEWAAADNRCWSIEEVVFSPKCDPIT